jgi:hypothetical protein
MVEKLAHAVMYTAGLTLIAFDVVAFRHHHWSQPWPLEKTERNKNEH